MASMEDNISTKAIYMYLSTLASLPGFGASVIPAMETHGQIVSEKNM